MKNLATLTLLLLVATTAFGQKLIEEEGDIKRLKDIKVYKMEFDYTDVQIPKFDNEEAFLKDKMDKREEKEAGDGERFKKSWFDDRPERYHPKFIESFNKRFDDSAVQVQEEEADYTMKIHTTKLYPGYNVGIVRHNAEIDATITVFKTADESNVLFSGSYKDVQGSGAMGYDYDSGYRISECYAKLAKTFAKDLEKKAL
ncbi:hypothetical protein SAMN05421636_101233 [Pricia antarctica]|uniref:DUF4468 domain-containing protein n=1 Tax=Pricia antarctica TaxID=641691 RepID=A0A1G6WBA2_9FLAO|nr:hypothetical protein [Pricia antarctica]SDD62355.1 hypothetical protein SAMN05421636_101233 [Pricia antarctica]